MTAQIIPFPKPFKTSSERRVDQLVEILEAAMNRPRNEDEKQVGDFFRKGLSGDKVT